MSSSATADAASSASSVTSRFLLLFCLVFSGEMIFSLPFHVPRYFRPTVLEVFGFSNTQLGDVFALYGVMAMLSYFPGGVIADRFSDRKLMTVSLIATALGGLAMATIPSPRVTALVYGYWGVSSVLLFWAALIRATRVWGGTEAQGRAFGLLDGGRGLIGAAAASLGVFVLGSFLPDVVESASPEERRRGLQAVIYLYSGITAFAALLVWRLVPEREVEASALRRSPFAGMLEVLRKPIVWVQALIVVCAYCGFKGIDNFSLYAVQVLGMDEVAGANLSANATYIRPVACIAAGLLADRFTGGRTLAAVFAAMAAVYTIFVFAETMGAVRNLLFANVFVAFFGVFAMRGVYFALLEETATPPRITGTAVGLISVVGYTPDIFFAAVTGRILDASPGLAGHQNFFLFLVGVMVLGVGVAVTLLWLNRSAVESPTAAEG
ncbi:MAG: MFS transporter [Acidobacteriota bacterium]